MSPESNKIVEEQSNIDKCDLSPDGIHCVHWWEGEPCDYCGSDEGQVDDVHPTLL